MSKSKKNLIIISSIVGALVLFAIIFGTLFNLRTIKVDYATTVNRVQGYTKEEIISKSKVKKGKNLLFANYKNNEETLEKEFPYAEFNLVRVFPNTLIIYIYERTPVFRVKQSGFWYIFDEDLKCLEIVPNTNIGLFNNDKIPVLNVQGLNLELTEGEFLNNEQLKKTITEIVDGVYGFESTPINIVSDITLSNDDILGTRIISLTMRNDGVKLIILGTDYVVEKIAYGLSAYAQDVSQRPEFQDKLDQISITVLESFTPDKPNGKIVVNDGTNQ